MAFMDMILQGTMNTVQIQTFDQLSQPDAFMNALMDGMCQHSGFPEQKAEIVRHNDNPRSKTYSERKDENGIEPLRSEMESSFIASGDYSIAQGGRYCYNQ